MSDQTLWKRNQQNQLRSRHSVDVTNISGDCSFLTKKEWPTHPKPGRYSRCIYKQSVEIWCQFKKPGPDSQASYIRFKVVGYKLKTL